MIIKGGNGGNETDLTKYQNWHGPTLTSPRTINGTVSVVFWSAIKDFTQNKRGVVDVLVRDLNPSTGTNTAIGSASINVANWQGGSTTWVSRTASIAVSNYTLQSGRRLALRFTVHSNAGDDMWFAFDTTAYSSSLTLP